MPISMAGVILPSLYGRSAA